MKSEFMSLERIYRLTGICQGPSPFFRGVNTSCGRLIPLPRFRVSVDELSTCNNDGFWNPLVHVIISFLQRVSQPFDLSDNDAQTYLCAWAALIAADLREEKET